MTFCVVFLGLLIGGFLSCVAFVYTLWSGERRVVRHLQVMSITLGFWATALYLATVVVSFIQ